MSPLRRAPGTFVVAILLDGTTTLRSSRGSWPSSSFACVLRQLPSNMRRQSRGLTKRSAPSARLTFLRVPCASHHETQFEGYDFSPTRKLRYVWICVLCSVSLNRMCRFKWPNPSGDEVRVQDPVSNLKELLIDPQAPEEAGQYVPTEREWMNEPSSGESSFSMDDLGSSAGEVSSSAEPSPGVTPQKPTDK